MCTEMPTAICARDAAGMANISKASSSNRKVFTVRMILTFLVSGLALLNGLARALDMPLAFPSPLNPFLPEKSRRLGCPSGQVRGKRYVCWSYHFLQTEIFPSFLIHIRTDTRSSATSISSSESRTRDFFA